MKALATGLKARRWMLLAAIVLSGTGQIAAQTGWPNNMPDAEDEFGLRFETQASTGVAEWFVSEPYLNLWIYTQPSTYYTSWGEPMGLSLAFKQRNTRTVGNGPLGKGWKITGYSYIVCTWDGAKFVAGNCYMPLGGERTYVADGDTKQFKSGSTMRITGSLSTGPMITITYPSGRTLFYSYWDNVCVYLATDTDPKQRSTSYLWSMWPHGFMRLENRWDWDGASVTGAVGISTN